MEVNTRYINFTTISFIIITNLAYFFNNESGKVNYTNMIGIAITFLLMVFSLSILLVFTEKTLLNYSRSIFKGLIIYTLCLYIKFIYNTDSLSSFRWGFLLSSIILNVSDSLNSNLITSIKLYFFTYSLNFFILIGFCFCSDKVYDNLLHDAIFLINTLLAFVSSNAVEYYSFNKSKSNRNRNPNKELHNDEYFQNLKYIFDNVNPIMIIIDNTNWNITTNLSFKKLLSQLQAVNPDKEFDYNDYYNNSPEFLRKFVETILVSEKFKNLVKEININVEFDKIFSNDPMKTLNNNLIIFLKNIYYINNFLNNLQNKNESSKKVANLNKLLLSFFNNTNILNNTSLQNNFINLGMYLVKNNKNLEDEKFISTIEIHHQKAKILDLELINIVIYDKSDLTNFEEERNLNKKRKDYLSNVAHEFKSPIQALILIVREIAVKHAELKYLCQDKFHDVEDLGNYILLLILDIISFAKEEMSLDIRYGVIPKMQIFNFGHAMLKILIKNNSIKALTINTILYVDPKLPDEINCDEMRVKQVMVNFLSNAYKFTFVGEIKLTAKLIKSTEHYDEILVTIEDTGIGIKPEDRDKLFKQFGKLEDKQSINRQGTGLGLSICKKIVRRIGGCIGYEPKTVGSKFYFSFYHAKSDLIVEQIEQNKDTSMKEVIALIDKEGEIEKKPQPKQNLLKLRSISDNLPYIKKEETLDYLFRIDNLVKNSLHNSDSLRVNYTYNSTLTPSIHFSDKIDVTQLATVVNNNSINPSNRANVNILNLSITKVNSITIESPSSKVLTNKPKNENEFIHYNIDEENADDDDLDSVLGINKLENQGSVKLSNEKIDELKDDVTLGIPSEVYSFYKVQKDDSIYEKEIPTSSLNIIKSPEPVKHNNKRIDFFSDMYTLILNMIKTDNTEFEKIYRVFKAYLKFFVKSLKNNSSPKTFKTKIPIRICVADDNTSILKAAKTIIKNYNEKEKKNIDLIKASDGIEALSLFLIDYCYKKTIKYIITDQNMGFMNGIELIRLINIFDSEKSVKLYLSSADNDKELPDAKNLSFEFLKKPINQSDLKRILNK